MRFLLLALFLIGSALGDENSELPLFRSEILELTSCCQMIMVTTQQWSDIPAQVHFFERKNALSSWQEALPPCDAVVGMRGLAWGIGLHGGPPQEKDGGTIKQEGDLCSPAGVFELGEAFGSASPEEAAALTTFPYRQITPTVEAVDDPHSGYYNRIVDTLDIENKDWSGYETMLRSDGLYHWGAVIKHNWKPYPSYGSAIFLHIWRNAQSGTAGCTAMSSENIKSLLRWLDTTKYPLLIQLPEAEYQKLKEPWHLPEIESTRESYHE